MIVPKVGGFRLFRYASERRQLLRCRACRKTFKRENQWRHLETELRRWGCPSSGYHVRAVRIGLDDHRLVCPGEAALAIRRKFLARARKSRRNLAHSRFEYQVGRKRDWRAMDREDAVRGKDVS